VKILIDTNIFLWMLSCPEKLNKNHTSFLFIAEMTNTNGIQSQQTHSK